MKPSSCHAAMPGAAPSTPQALPDMELLLRQHLAQHACWRAVADETPQIFDAAATALLAPGKRLRPRLFLLAAQGYGQRDLAALAPVALALELAHTFVITHDDLIDNTQSRRTLPALSVKLERAFRRSPPRGFSGRDGALVLGDLFYTIAMELLGELEAPAGARLNAVGLFAGAAQATARGALREITLAATPLQHLTFAAITETYRLKTAAYTFALPLQLANLFAAGKAASSAIDAFAATAGVAFQLRNDFDPLAAWQAGGQLPDDIRDLRPTTALLYTWNSMPPAARAALRRGETTTILHHMETCGTLSWLSEEIRWLAATAKENIAMLSLNRESAAALAQIIGSIIP